MLNDFTSPYDATVVRLLKEAGVVIVGKTNMDEFGMGSHSTNSHFGPVKMVKPSGEEFSAGGSSGGSAVAVASDQVWAALGTDTGGSVRLPAAYTGVFGFKPSYGLLSRWGVIAYANSLDTVGIIGQNTVAVKHIFSALNVEDVNDPTSLPTALRINKRIRGMAASLRIGVPLDYNIDTLQPEVKELWLRTLRGMWKYGHTLHPIRLPTTQQALSAYYVLAPAEASSNLAKYDGVRFGSRAAGTDGTSDSVLFAKTRGQGFGPEVQRRILLGTFSLSAQAIDNYFIQAQKVRRLVQQDFNRVFRTQNPLFDTQDDWDESDKVDVIICPTAPSTAPPLSEAETQDPIQSYTNDVFTVPASLAGLPAMTVPIQDKDGKEDPIGLQIIGQYGDDEQVFRAADTIDRVKQYYMQKESPATSPATSVFSNLASYFRG
ncbi:GatA Asp-tRNAAsn Glu-tRNAGln amidotransferase A subunit [Pyrenophora tritici-repentis]|nr:Glutamyl-tRNA(Gln) amidotransferase subunit A mitochondrial [Pyrenophora tritici-repentis]KAF7443566.1 Glutamyl-tRNA amidotransferase protein [Pyrenophora tritici-repentis]KAF7566718.1 GatA, Asp-tRNAAsn-Glu-tRNAGln amidotransferase A subunit and related amidase [Pyrenophora tritici-repentis]KAG9379306.1 Glutamyl-tRNA amidotransferase protein [Pyrenophora tritici-repentis]KAI0573770.1 Glutamyl-tRNA(Gln) amidotransferase subunit A mitochondrial [Pyrenophora tritici-repentis]